MKNKYCCIIRTYDPELTEYLEGLGYRSINNDGTTLDAHNFDGRGHHKKVSEGNAIITSLGGWYGVIYAPDSVAERERIDCARDRELFKLLTAVTDENDYGQLFYNGHHYFVCTCGRFEGSELFDREYGVQIKDGTGYHKAGPDEIRRYVAMSGDPMDWFHRQIMDMSGRDGMSDEQRDYIRHVITRTYELVRDHPRTADIYFEEQNNLYN